MLSTFRFLWGNGGRSVVGAIALAMVAILVLAATWTTVRFWPGDGPHDPLVISGPLEVLSLEVPIGGSLIYRNDTCNRSGEILDVLYHVSWVKEGGGKSIPSFTGIFANPVGCMHNITTIPLAAGIGLGTWRRTGVAEFDYQGQHRSVTFTTEPFEVVPWKE